MRGCAMRSSHAFRTGCTPRPAPRPRAGRPPCADRAGRALVDVLVALVVLGLCGAATLDTFRASLIAMDRIAFVHTAHLLARDAAEGVHASPCDVASGVANRDRTTLAWTGTRVGPLASMVLDATSAPHPATSHAPRALEGRASGWCR